MSARRLRTEACFVVAAIMTTASAAPNGIAGLGSEAVAAPMGDNVTNAQLPISERFRTSEGAFRSLHPTHSISARGPGAEELVAGHELADTPFGAGTPFQKLIERGAKQVYFGSGVGAITVYHAYECLREPRYPIEVFLPQRMPARCIDADGNELIVHTLVHDPRVTAERIDSNPPLEAQVRQRLIAGGMRSVELGRGEIFAQPLPAMMDTFERMLGEGRTIYPPELLAEARVG